MFNLAIFTCMCIFIAEYEIPVDTVILFNVWRLHHDSKHWNHPMKFNPDR